MYMVHLHKVTVPHDACFNSLPLLSTQILCGKHTRGGGGDWEKTKENGGTEEKKGKQMPF